MEKLYLAYDIGGTHIKYGIVDDSGCVRFHDLVPTDAHLGGTYILNKLIELGRPIQKKYTLSGISVSTAGRINPQTGIVIGANDSIPGYVNLNIKQILSDAFQLPVTARNDAECAILCEKWLGGHQAKNFIMLTIGTGIGGGIIIHNEVYSGHSFSAGEWGRMNINGLPFEETASLSALIHMATEYDSSIQWTGKKVFDAFDKGELEIQRIVDVFYRHLAIGLSNLIYIFNPQKIIIGGGLTHRGNKMLQELMEYMTKYTETDFLASTDIVLSKFSNQAGMIGAVYSDLM